MIELVIGADGHIGSRLAAFSGAEGTSRASPEFTHHHHLDLLHFDEKQLPDADVIYGCAGVNGAAQCEGNSAAHRVNVDATVRLARHYAMRGGFFVWISSTTVEWSNSAYARQKLAAETVLIGMRRVGIVRAGRVIDANVDDLCATLMHVGRRRIEGLTLWGANEPPYQR